MPNVNKIDPYNFEE